MSSWLKNNNNKPLVCPLLQLICPLGEFMMRFVLLQCPPVLFILILSRPCAANETSKSMNQVTNEMLTSLSWPSLQAEIFARLSMMYSIAHKLVYTDNRCLKPPNRKTCHQHCNTFQIPASRTDCAQEILLVLPPDHCWLECPSWGHCHCIHLIYIHLKHTMGHLQ